MKSSTANHRSRYRDGIDAVTPKETGSTASGKAPETGNAHPGRGVDDDEMRAERAARLEFVNQMLAELHKISLALDEQTLAYLLEMAVLECHESRRVHEFRTEIF